MHGCGLEWSAYIRQTDPNKSRKRGGTHARHAAPTRPAAADRVRALDPAPLSRLRCARHATIGLPRVPELRVVAMRLKERTAPKGLPDGRGRADGRSGQRSEGTLQLPIDSSSRPPDRPTALPILDE